MKFAFGPETHPLPGYTIKRAIDRGGFGEVYYAVSDSGKEVALKLLRDNPDIELRGVSQCLNLKHPNLVTLFDVRKDPDGESWVIMEYISGESLEQVLSAHPQGLPPEEVLQWLTGAADGIAHLHDRDIVHRDLKPANIFRDGGVVKIGDVGLSKFMTPSRRSAQTESVGTVHYMAPEVARGKYGRELDVYSLAVIVFEMLTGRVPFDGESTAEILMKHLTARPDLTAAPAPFRRVLERALEKDPHRRTQTIRQFVEEFHKALRASQPELEPGVRIPVHTSATNGRAHSANGTARGADRSVAETSRRAVSTGRNPVANCRTRPRRGARSDRKSGWCWKSFWLWIAVPLGILFLIRSGHGMFRGGFLPRGWFIVALIGAAAYVTYAVVSTLVNQLLSPTDAGTSSRTSPDLPQDGTANRNGAVPAIQRANGTACATPGEQPHRRIWLGPEIVRPISVASRWQDIFTSMTWAAFWTVISTAAVSIGVQILGIAPDASPVSTRGVLGLFAFTTLAASWVLIAGTKLMEGSETSSQQRRLVLAICGAIVGLIAGTLNDMLQATLNTHPMTSVGLVRRIGHWDLVNSTSTLGHEASLQSLTPNLAGFMTFFAVLFAPLRRWSNQSDSFRSKRFRWFSWFFSGIVAWSVTMAFSFPSIWAVSWGFAVSMVVQLSSGWIVPNERSAWIQAERERIAKAGSDAPVLSQTTGVS